MLSYHSVFNLKWLLIIKHVLKRQPCEARRGLPLHAFTNARSLESSDSSRESADAAHLYLTTRGRCHETSLPAAQYLPGAPLKLAKPHITYSMGCPNLRKLPPDWPDWFPSTVQTINGWSIPFRFALLEAGSCPHRAGYFPKSPLDLRVTH